MFQTGRSEQVWNKNNPDTRSHQIDELKVDMSFIKDIEQKPQNQAHQYRIYRVIGFRHGIRRFGGAWKREGIVSHFITALYRGDFAAGIYFKPPFSGGWCMARVLDHGICFSSDLMDHMQKRDFSVRHIQQCFKLVDLNRFGIKITLIPGRTKLMS